MPSVKFSLKKPTIKGQYLSTPSLVPQQQIIASSPRRRFLSVAEGWELLWPCLHQRSPRPPLLLLLRCLHQPPSATITTTLAMIHVPPLPPPILLYLNRTQLREEEEFLMATSLISTSCTILLLLLQTHFLNIPPFHLPHHPVRPPAHVIYMPSISLSLPFHLLNFIIVKLMHRIC